MSGSEFRPRHHLILPDDPRVSRLSSRSRVMTIEIDTAATSGTVRMRRSSALGVLAACAAVTLMATYPAVTRLSVTTTLTPADLLMLRLGISGLAFVPYLVWKARDVPRTAWQAGLKLSFFHGWGMAG